MLGTTLSLSKGRGGRRCYCTMFEEDAGAAGGVDDVVSQPSIAAA
jgi:hypothetical protein